jgi:hypothetical protein
VIDGTFDTLLVLLTVTETDPELERDPEPEIIPELELINVLVIVGIFEVEIVVVCIGEIV